MRWNTYIYDAYCDAVHILPPSIPDTSNYSAWAETRITKSNQTKANQTRPLHSTTIMTSAHPDQPSNLATTAASLSQTWHPIHVLTLNNTVSFKVARISNDFIWHSHPNTDEVFLVVSGGPLILELDREPRRFPARGQATSAERTRSDEEDPDPEGGFDRVELKVGDCFVVPQGMRHRPIAPEGETGILMVEGVGTTNTGDRADTAAGRELTVEVAET